MTFIKQISCLVLAGIIVTAAGCTTPGGDVDRTGTGILTGAGIGAATGAIIGSMKGKAGEGALIGGALGGLTGGIVGAAIDDAAKQRLRQESPQTLYRVEQGQPLALADIKALSKAGVSETVIISQIRNTRSVYRLTTSEIIELKQAGVSERVIDYMINTAQYSPSTPPPPPPPPSSPPPSPYRY